MYKEDYMMFWNLSIFIYKIKYIDGMSYRFASQTSRVSHFLRLIIGITL